MVKPASITLVDDHVVVRNALKELIETMGDYRIDHQYNNGEELIQALTSGHTPDLVIMDLIMPVKSGLDTLEWLHAQQIAQRVLMLSMETDKKMIARLHRLGMSGYLAKDCSSQTLLQAIDDILKKGHHYNDLLIAALDYDEQPAVDMRSRMLAVLNERELEFLRLVCRDEEYTYKEIAGIMNVHRRTIDGYRERLFEKCKVISKSGLVQFAMKHRLV